MLPNEAHDLAISYRRLVELGRWFEVFDGVVVGGGTCVVNLQGDLSL